MPFNKENLFKLLCTLQGIFLNYPHYSEYFSFQIIIFEMLNLTLCRNLTKCREIYLK